MNAIEILDSETYESIRHYHADLDTIPYQRNAEYRAAVDRKIERSWPKLNGTPGTQLGGPQVKNMAVQVHSDGSMSVGSPGEVAAGRNAAKDRVTAQKNATIGQLQKYMGVQTKR